MVLIVISVFLQFKVVRINSHYNFFHFATVSNTISNFFSLWRKLANIFDKLHHKKLKSELQVKISHFPPFQVLTHNHHVQDGDGAGQVFIFEEVEIFFVFFDFNFCNFTFPLRSLPLSSDPELHLPSSSSLLWERSGTWICKSWKYILSTNN